MQNKKFIKLYKKFQKNHNDLKFILNNSDNFSANNNSNYNANVFLLKIINPVSLKTPIVHYKNNSIVNIKTEQLHIHYKSKMAFPKALMRLFYTKKNEPLGSDIEIFQYVLQFQNEQAQLNYQKKLSKIQLSNIVNNVLHQHMENYKQYTKKQKINDFLIGAFLYHKACSYFISASELKQCWLVKAPIIKNIYNEVIKNTNKIYASIDNTHHLLRKIYLTNACMLSKKYFKPEIL